MKLHELGLDEKSRQAEMLYKSKMNRNKGKNSKLALKSVSVTPPVLRVRAAKSPQAEFEANPPPTIDRKRKARDPTKDQAAGRKRGKVSGPPQPLPPPPTGPPQPVPPPPPGSLFNPPDPFGIDLGVNELSTLCARKVLNNSMYKHTWAHFSSTVGEETVAWLKSGVLTITQVDEIVSNYIRTRVNLKEMKKVILPFSILIHSGHI